MTHYLSPWYFFILHFICLKHHLSIAILCWFSCKHYTLLKYIIWYYQKRGRKNLAFMLNSNDVRVKQMLKLKCNSIWPWLWKGIRCAYCVVNKTCNVYVNLWELRKKSKTLHVYLEIDRLKISDRWALILCLCEIERKSERRERERERETTRNNRETRENISF